MLPLAHNVEDMPSKVKAWFRSLKARIASGCRRAFGARAGEFFQADPTPLKCLKSL